ncbi:MAG TPA: polyprenol monophosphomannose synthase [Patescibacteria group bacterium]|nr:polyprenol monophosphomannose synthase [Patescibacteria group bacterium]
MSKNSDLPIRLAIAIPTYNEASNLPKLLTLVKKNIQKTDVDCTVLVIDDNSPDGTGDVAEKLATQENTKHFTITVLHRPGKQGIGKAYIHGLSTLLKQKKFDYIIQMDADLSHNPKYLIDLINEAKKGRDFVATSRYMKGGGILDWGLHRRILSRGGNIYTRLILGNKITDYTNGLNMFSTKLLNELDVDSLGSTGYGFFIELKHKAVAHAKNFAQIPIILTDREQGKSKIPKNTIFINLLLVPRLKFKSRAK